TIIDNLNIIQRLLFERPVLGADRISALKRHVLEHMGEPSAASGIIHSPSVDVRIKGNHRRIVALNNNKAQPVREREISDFLFEVLEALGWKKARKKQEKTTLHTSSVTWSTHFCVPRRQFCRRFFKPDQPSLVWGNIKVVVPRIVRIKARITPR